jgi:hypothetical protein
MSCGVLYDGEIIDQKAWTIQMTLGKGRGTSRFVFLNATDERGNNEKRRRTDIGMSKVTCFIDAASLGYLLAAGQSGTGHCSDCVV